MSQIGDNRRQVNSFLSSALFTLSPDSFFDVPISYANIRREWLMSRWPTLWLHRPPKNKPQEFSPKSTEMNNSHGILFSGQFRYHYCITIWITKIIEIVANCHWNAMTSNREYFLVLIANVLLHIAAFSKLLVFSTLPSDLSHFRKFLRHHYVTVRSLPHVHFLKLPTKNYVMDCFYIFVTGEPTITSSRIL